MVSAASGDALMIAAARSCFSAYRFDGEAALFACGLCHSLGGAWSVGCSSCLVPTYS